MWKGEANSLTAHINTKKDTRTHRISENYIIEQKITVKETTKIYGTNRRSENHISDLENISGEDLIEGLGTEGQSRSEDKVRLVEDLLSSQGHNPMYFKHHYEFK